MTARRAGLILLVGVGILVGGCDWNRAGFEIDNPTGVVLDVFETSAGEAPLALDIRPDGGTVVHRAECAGLPVIARDPEGREIARRDVPLCSGDTWTIAVQGPVP